MKARKQINRRTVVSQRVAKLQRAAEKEMRKQWERVVEMLPPAVRKAAKRFTGDVDRARRDLRKRGERMIADARKARENFVAEAEKRFTTALTPVTRRLDIATRAEVERLRKRLEHVERRVQSHPSVA